MSKIRLSFSLRRFCQESGLAANTAWQPAQIQLEK